MIYLDTSTLVPLFVREPTSEAVRQQLSTLPANELTISEWTKAEFVSAVGIRARTGHLDPQVGSGIVQALYEMADRSLLVLAPETGDFVDAARYCEQFNLALRAGDALHLAIASNRGARMLYSLDRRMVECARRPKIKARLLV